MTSSGLILTVKFVFNGYRIAASPEKVTSREIEFGLSRDGLCGQPTGSDRINRSVDTSSTLAPECRIPAEVLERNLIPRGGLTSWSENWFIKILGTGITPYGRQLNNEMP